METCRTFGDRVGFLWFFLGVFLLFHCGKAENRTDPTDNVNLAPFWGIRSAYWCMQNFTSRSCPDKYILKEAGWPNVTNGDAVSYCNSGCANHTKAVLTCIYYVKRDYWFADQATVRDINKTIDFVCNDPSGFNGISPYLPKSGYGKKKVPTVLALSAMVLVTLFHM